jgi:hypothetical protein
MKERITIITLVTIALLLLTGIEAMGQKTTPTPPDPRIHPTTGPVTSPTQIKLTRQPPVVVTNTVGRPVGAFPVTSLSVRVVTSNLPSAGTDSDVFFNVGPVAWKLDKDGVNDFGSGDDEVYILYLDRAWHLTTDDILWMRLQLEGNDTWKPQTVELLVNGSVYSRADIRGVELDESHPYWVGSVTRASAYSREEQFIRSLRIAGFTFNTTPRLSTPPWVQDLPDICATGIVLLANDVTNPMDGYIPVILRVEGIRYGVQERITGHAQNYTLDAANGINLTHYLNVRYTVQTDHDLRPNQRVRICGDVRWVSGFGFDGGEYVLIPRTQADTTFPR